MAKHKIVDFRKLPSADPKRLGKQDMLFIVEISPDVRLPVRLPAEDFSDEKLQEAVRNVMSERGSWIGREIEA